MTAATTPRATKAAIIGSGNIGTDLMIKVLRSTGGLQLSAMAGIDPSSEGLARAQRLGVSTTADGVDGLIAMDAFDDIEIVFDATSAEGHLLNARALRPHRKKLIDLTPAATGPYIVPAVNLDAHLDEPDVNMVTCGGQATVPVVAAISRATPVHYAEIVAAIASKSAGPGTRASIDEFTETTAAALEEVGGAARGRAIIVLNPAEPPVLMRDTVLALIGEADPDAIRESIHDAVAEVAAYVPGYRLAQEVQFTPLDDLPVGSLLPDEVTATTQVSVLLEVEGAGHHLPAYAGNLDIMTSAALRVAERFAQEAHRRQEPTR